MVRQSDGEQLIGYHAAKAYSVRSLLMKATKYEIGAIF